MFGPPMMFPPPGFFKPQRSFARVIFTTLATAVFGLSVTLNLYLLLYAGLGGLGGGQGITQETVVAGSSDERVAVIPVSGIILKRTAERFDELLTSVEKDKNVKAVVLDVDTLGGAVAPSDEIHARILRFKKEHPGKPVVVTMGSFATSGGYYISCAGDYVFAQPQTLTGNIGVILPRFNFSKLAQSYGVEEVTVTAPEHGFKNAGSPFAPIKQEENQYLQGLIDDAYGKFKLVVSTGRQGRLTKKIDDIANGKVYTASEAMALGLVDELGYANDAYAKAASLAGLSNKEVVRYAKPVGILEALAGGADGKSNVGGGATGGVTVNGVNVKIDAGLLDELSRPRLMYLWRGQ